MTLHIQQPRVQTLFKLPTLRLVDADGVVSDSSTVVSVCGRDEAIQVDTMEIAGNKQGERRLNSKK